MEVEMLKEKLAKWNMDANQKINDSKKRDEDSEAALQRAIEKNVRLEGIWESQMNIMKKLEAVLKAIEEEMKEVDASKVKATTLKAMEDFRASTKFFDEKVNAASKAMGDF